MGKEEKKVEKGESLSNKLQGSQGGNQDAGSREVSYGNDPLILVVPRAQSEKISSWSDNLVLMSTEESTHQDFISSDEGAMPI
jgi:hypothetical protein